MFERFHHLGIASQQQFAIFTFEVGEDFSVILVCAPYDAHVYAQIELTTAHNPLQKIAQSVRCRGTIELPLVDQIFFCHSPSTES